MIEGQHRDGTYGVCVWCWFTTSDWGYAPFLERYVPLHVTCAMQMLSCKRKLDRGYPVPGNTVAGRRYWRMARVLARQFRLLREEHHLLYTGRHGPRREPGAEG